MESVIDWIYKNYFSWSCEEEFHDRLLERRKKEVQEQYGSLMQKLKETDENIYQEFWLVFSHIIKDLTAERADMFTVGFSVGAKLMMEILTVQ